eukprot:RCo048318
MPTSGDATVPCGSSIPTARRTVTLQAEANVFQGGQGYFPSASLLRCCSCCNLPSIQCCRRCRPRHCQIPIWALLVGLSTLSLVVVGVLAFELTELGSEDAINFVG